MRLRATSSTSLRSALFISSVLLVTMAISAGAGARESTPIDQGDRLWVTDTHRGDEAYALGVSPDGSRVFVTGTGVGNDYITVAHDAATGAKLWASEYNAFGNSIDVARALGVSPDGSTVFVTGLSQGETGDYEYGTVAYDAATGAQLWAGRYNGSGEGYHYAYALGVSPDGSTVFVTGNSTQPVTGEDFATVAYDAATGAELWATRYHGNGNAAEEASALGVSPDGSTVFVTGGGDGGATNDESDDDYVTIAYDAATGAQLWLTRYDGPVDGYASARALGVDPEGIATFATGWSLGRDESYDYATVAYDAATGAQLWTSRYSGPGSHDDFALALGVGPDGSTVFVTGYTDRELDGNDYGTVAYDAATGAQLWATRYHGPGGFADDSQALGVSPDGSAVFVTGIGNGADYNDDFITFAYDADTGGVLWRARLGDGSADAVGVSPSGTTVYVTGFRTDAVGCCSDYATVAYEA